MYHLCTNLYTQSTKMHLLQVNIEGYTKVWEKVHTITITFTPGSEINQGLGKRKCPRYSK